MSKDLRDVLHDFVTEEAAVARREAPDAAGEVAVLSRRVARRRVVRTGAVAVTSAAAVAGIAVGVQALTPDEPTTPPATRTPMPSVTPSPSTTPSPDPSPTQTTPPDDGVTRHPLLPPEALPWEDGLLDRVTTGWSLVLRTAQPVDGPEVSVLYLVEPSGQAYERPFAWTEDELDLGDWSPQSGTALLYGYRDPYVLDLRSGEVTPLAVSGVQGGGGAMMADGTVLLPAADDGALRRVDPRTGESRLVAEVPLGGWSLDAEGTAVVVATTAGPMVVERLDGSQATLAVPPPGGECAPRGWDGDAVIAICGDLYPPGPWRVGDAPVSNLWRIPIDGSSASPLTSADKSQPLPFDVEGIWRVDGRTVLGVMPRVPVGNELPDGSEMTVPDGREPNLHELVDGELVELPAPVISRTAAVADGALVGPMTGPSQDEGRFVRLDPFTGEGESVLPLPASSADGSVRDYGSVAP